MALWYPTRVPGDNPPAHHSMSNPSHPESSNDTPLTAGNPPEPSDFMDSEVPSARRRRRRSERRSGLDLFSFGRSRGRGRSSGRRSKPDNQSMILIACVVLLILVVGFVAFLAGKKSAMAKSAEPLPKIEDVTANAETEALLDSAFAYSAKGDAQRAFLEFQKAHDAQPGLPGIDYLVGCSALRSGEVALAKGAFERAVSKNEMDAESRVFLALITLDESGKVNAASAQMSDPFVAAESELRHYATTHPMSASIYRKWADIHRQRGSYRTASDLLTKAVLRADSDDDLSLLQAKLTLTKLQNQPAKEAPGTAMMASMSADELLGAALASFQGKASADAIVFLDKAREFYPPRVFREIIADNAFDEFRSDAKFLKFSESLSHSSSMP